jgi:hypothetical protein
MKMQVRHVHAGIRSTGLRGFDGQLIYKSDFERVSRRSTDDWRYGHSLEREGIPVIFIHRIQGEGYNMILGPHLRRLRHRTALG